MTRLESLVLEFAHETAITRTHLARLPDASFEWRPHPRSFTAGELACHMIDCIALATAVFGADELDIDPATHQTCRTASEAALIETFDAAVAAALAAMAASDDSDAVRPWRFKIRGKVRFEKSREAAFRDMALSHLVHHRGQFSVYLRLLEVRVPGSYGPTADDAR